MSYPSNSKPRCPYDEFSVVTKNYTLGNLIYFDEKINDIHNPISFRSGGRFVRVSMDIDVNALAC